MENTEQKEISESQLIDWYRKVNGYYRCLQTEFFPSYNICSAIEHLKKSLEELEKLCKRPYADEDEEKVSYLQYDTQFERTENIAKDVFLFWQNDIQRAVIESNIFDKYTEFEVNFMHARNALTWEAERMLTLKIRSINEKITVPKSWY